MWLTEGGRDFAGCRSDSKLRKLQVLVVRDLSFLENVVGRRRIDREVVKTNSGVKDIYDRVGLRRPVGIRDWICPYAVWPPESGCNRATVSIDKVESIFRDLAAYRILHRGKMKTTATVERRSS